MYLNQNKAIQEALDTLCPEICYQPSSPFRGYGKNKSPYEGDYHSWSVLAGSKPISYFEEGFSRFYSEYGYESFDYYESLVKYAPRKEDQSIYSDVMLWHQRQGYNAIRANGNIIRYISDNYPAPKTFKDTLYASHVLQADAIKLAIEAHRRNKGFCWGSLYWQLGNCWPVSSDSSIDYEGNWKGLHYIVKKAFEDRLVSGYIHNDTLDVYIGKHPTACFGTPARRNFPRLFSRFFVSVSPFWTGPSPRTKRPNGAPVQYVPSQPF